MLVIKVKAFQQKLSKAMVGNTKDESITVGDLNVQQMA